MANGVNRLIFIYVLLRIYVFKLQYQIELSNREENWYLNRLLRDSWLESFSDDTFYFAAMILNEVMTILENKK